MFSLPNKIFCFLFIFIGFILIIAGSIFAFRTYQFVEAASSANAKVVELNYGASHPRIAFTTQDGKEITYSQNGLTGGYSVGDEIIVLYEPRNPQNACVNAFGALWGGDLAIFMMGIAFVAVGFFKLFNPDSKWIYWKT